MWLSFFQYFWGFKEKLWPNTFCGYCSEALYNSYDHAHTPGQHMWPNPGPWPNSKCSKTVEVGCSCSELKSARVSTLTGSLAQCHAKWPRGSREFHHPAGIEPEQPYSLLLTLTTKAWVLVCLQKKMNISSSVLQPVLVLQLLFWVQDCRSQIAQVVYQGQAQKNRTLKLKPLIDTPYRIRHRMELKYFHLAQFLPITHRAAHKPWNSENWELKI